MAKARWIRGKVRKIRVSEQTAEELKKLKRFPDENYDTVIRRLIKYYRSGFRPRFEGL